MKNKGMQYNDCLCSLAYIQFSKDAFVRYFTRRHTKLGVLHQVTLFLNVDFFEIVDDPKLSITDQLSYVAVSPT